MGVSTQTDADRFMAELGLPEVYRVGGSVRNELLGRSAKDHDYLARGATAKEITGAFQKHDCKPKHLKLRDGRVVGVRGSLPNFGLIEVVLPRKEVSTGKGHRDFEIVCDPKVTLAEDAERRDFTMNALYMDVVTGDVHDPLGNGRDDLLHACIRTTHPDSFRDDPLRALRGLRFMATLGFDLAESTFKEMTQYAECVNALTLKGVSGTALDELCKLLMGDWPKDALEMMRYSGVLDVLLPELSSIIGYEQESAYHDKTLDEHTFDAVQEAANAEAPLRVRLALLFHDAGKPWMAWSDEHGRKHYYGLKPTEAREIGAPPTACESHEYWSAWLAKRCLDRLNTPRDLLNGVVKLIERHMLPLEGVKTIKVRTWRSELGDPLLSDLILHRKCDVGGKGGDTREALEALDRIAEQQREAIDLHVPLSPKGLAIDGTALTKLGLKGYTIGVVQRQLLHEVMSQEKLNTPEWLEARAVVLARKATDD